MQQVDKNSLTALREIVLGQESNVFRIDDCSASKTITINFVKHSYGVVICKRISAKNELQL